MADISISLDETLELDTIIKESSIAQNPINNITYSGSNSKDYNMKGIETHTSVFDPQQSGTYTIDINGQELSVEVTDTSAIPDSGGKHQWNAEKGEGTTLFDAIGNLDSSISGASWVSGLGAGGYHLDYDGSDYVDLGADSRSAFRHYVDEQEGTFFAWVYIRDWRDTPCSIISAGASSNDVNILFDFRNSNEMRWGAHDGSVKMWNVKTTTPSNPEDTWIPVAGTVGSGTARAYFGEDMTEFGTDSVGSSVSSDLSNNLYLGADEYATRWYHDGKIDIAFSDDREWSQSELKSFVDDSKNLYN